MADLVSELNRLDFSNYIGGPLQAAVEAQTSASLALVEFIEAVGFTPDATDKTKNVLRYVTFSYNKDIANPAFDPDQAISATNSVTIPQSFTLQVPFLTMLTMPALRIEEMEIDFNAKLTSAETSSASSSLGVNASLGINYKVVKFKASASYRRSTYRNSNVQKSYNLGVKVKAVNDELPGGLERIFDIMEANISETAD